MADGFFSSLYLFMQSLRTERTLVPGLKSHLSFIFNKLGVKRGIFFGGLQSEIAEIKVGAIFLADVAARRERGGGLSSTTPQKGGKKAPLFNECLPNLPKVRKTKERCNKVNIGRSEAAVNAP